MRLENTNLLRVCNNGRRMNPFEGGRTGRWCRPSKQGRLGLGRAWLHSFMHFCIMKDSPVGVTHVQWILHQAKRNKHNIPCSGFSEPEVMNQNQLKGNQICSGKPRPLWLWEYRQQWPQRDQTISLPSGIPFWNCLEPRYFRKTANCSGVHRFPKVLPQDFESQHLTNHIPLAKSLITLRRYLRTISQESYQQVTFWRDPEQNIITREVMMVKSGHQLGNSSWKKVIHGEPA